MRAYSAQSAGLLRLLAASVANLFSGAGLRPRTSFSVISLLRMSGLQLHRAFDRETIERENKRLVAGASAYIFNGCIMTCVAILESTRGL